jgi:hypothetical protein
MKAALIDSENNVTNVIVWDDTCITPSGTFAFVVENDATVAPGWTFADGAFQPPTEPEQVK